MAGVRLDPVLHRKRSAIGDALEFPCAILTLEVRIAAGVKLDHRCRELHGRGNLCFRRLDEEADANVRLASLSTKKRR